MGSQCVKCDAPDLMVPTSAPPEGPVLKRGADESPAINAMLRQLAAQPWHARDLASLRLVASWFRRSIDDECVEEMIAAYICAGGVRPAACSLRSLLLLQAPDILCLFEYVKTGCDPRGFHKQWHYLGRAARLSDLQDPTTGPGGGSGFGPACDFISQDGADTLAKNNTSMSHAYSIMNVWNSARVSLQNWASTNKISLAGFAALSGRPLTDPMCREWLDDLDERAWGGSLLHRATAEGKAFIAIALVDARANPAVINQSGFGTLDAAHSTLSSSTNRLLAKLHNKEVDYSAALERVRKDHDLHQRKKCIIS